MSLPSAFLDIPLAHRALHGAAGPENSPAAIRAAVAAGYGIEVDVQLSSDGVPMVFHDYALDRLTAESGPVAQRTAAALGAITLTGGTDTIPTLAQVLEIVAGTVPLLIEIKDQDGAMGRNVGPLERATCAALAGYSGDVALMSFNPHAVAVCAEAAPDIPRGLTTDLFHAPDWPTVPKERRQKLALIDTLDEVGACFISHNQAQLAAPRVLELRDEGWPILCWTIRSPEAEAKARKVAHNVTFEGYPA